MSDKFRDVALVKRLDHQVGDLPEDNFVGIEIVNVKLLLKLACEVYERQPEGKPTIVRFG